MPGCKYNSKYVTCLLNVQARKVNAGYKAIYLNCKDESDADDNNCLHNCCDVLVVLADKEVIGSCECFNVGNTLAVGESGIISVLQ